AVISLGGIVYSESVRIAGDQIDSAILNHLKREYSLLIGDQMAERIKMEIGSAYPLSEKKQMAVKGRDLVSGIPRTILIDDTEVRAALEDCVTTIIGAIRQALEHTPPELSGDIIDRGIVLTGGGSLLHGLDDRLREETSLPIVTVDDPLTSVVLGVGKTLEEISLLRKVSSPSTFSY
nr:rod shape-determining protein [Nitrospirales bacterium]